jgi:uncharacterized integral membrane protein
LLRRILRWIIGLPIAILVIGFVVANRRWTTLSLDPFTANEPSISIDLPLWLLFIFGVFIGIMVGWVGCWFAQAKWRKLARERSREISQLQSELESAKTASPNLSQDITPYVGLVP